MAKIKKLAKKYRFRNVLRLLFGTKPKFDTLCFDCPVCGARKYIKIPKTRPDGYIIEKTIIDEQPRAEFEKMEENANAGK